MKGLSNHTKLMNIIICLTQKNRSCEPVLFNNHYFLESIELSFNKKNGEIIHTDLALINPKINNLVFIECKDGGLELDQANRYASLETDDIINACVTTLSEKFSHEVVYIGCENKETKLVDNLRDNSFKFPVLIIDNEKIRLKHNNFNCHTLNGIFSNNGGVDIPEPSPVFYYPFGKDDSDAWILSRIGPVLMGLRGEEFDVEDVLKQIHQLYDYIDNTSLKDLKGRIGKLITKISKGEFNEFFDLPTNKKYKLKQFGVVKFQNKLNKYVEALSKKDRFLTKNEKKSNTDQTTLEDLIMSQ